MNDLYEHKFKRHSLLCTIHVIYTAVSVDTSVVWVKTQYQNIPDTNKLLIHSLIIQDSILKVMYHQIH